MVNCFVATSHRRNVMREGFETRERFESRDWDLTANFEKQQSSCHSCHLPPAAAGVAHTPPPSPEVSRSTLKLGLPYVGCLQKLKRAPVTHVAHFC